MSLTERVLRVHKESITATSNQKASRIESLKHELHQRISPDEIASITQENPFRAKNEVRSACSLIFEDERWSDCDSTERSELTEELINIVFGLGPLEAMLSDESITEIMVNGSQSLFYEREGKLFASEYRFSTDDQVRALIDRIIGPIGRRVDESSPMVNARLEQGHRVNAIIPPLSLGGPILTIRKFREHLYTLEEMVELRSMDESVKQFLEWAVLMRKNIAVSGGTGSGKTTLLNALSCVIPSSERIITIEDSAELRFTNHPHVVRLEARPQSAEGSGEVSIRTLMINALRMRPDRIIVGECRGGEALDMLQAMNTGHDGSLTTLHANSPHDAIMRMTTMVRYVADIPVAVIEAQIASAIDILVQTARAMDGRRYVQEIAALHNSPEHPEKKISILFQRNDEQDISCWHETPEWLDGLRYREFAQEEEVALWRQQASLSA